jgi:hypothetical protein
MSVVFSGLNSISFSRSFDHSHICILETEQKALGSVTSLGSSTLIWLHAQTDRLLNRNVDLYSVRC